MPIDVQVGDIVRLRKPHPCGGYDWQVVRIGADIGLKCQTCDHRVMLTRREFEKRVKTFVQRAQRAVEPGFSVRDNEVGHGETGF